SHSHKRTCTAEGNVMCKKGEHKVTKRKILLSAILATSLYQTVHADTNGSGQEVLVVAKIAGACGILDSIINFQKTTKMPGGDEFVSRFWSVEAARMGISIEQLSQRCDKAVVMYDKLWGAMEASAN
ncbi:MAG: hypothetical protein AB2689_28085, partial [Candidatus Thiodiazotropha taylori]